MADITTTQGDSAGTDGFDFIDETVSVGLGIFDHIYSTITGKPPAATPATHYPAPSQGNNLLLIALIGFGFYLALRR